MRRHPARAANPALQHLARPLRITLACANGHQHPGDVAHHVVQEGIGTDVQDNHLAMLADPQVMNLLDRRLGLALTGPKCAEIMTADQIRGRLGHALHVQRTMVPGHFLAQVRRTDLVVVDNVAIAPGDGLETGMEVSGHDPGPGHADIVGQVDIGPHDPGLETALGLGIEMHHLATGMHTGIGTPRTHQRHGRVGDLGQGLFQGFLYGRYPAGLALPAAVARSLVLHAKRDSEKTFGRHFGSRGRVDDIQGKTCLSVVTRARSIPVRSGLRALLHQASRAIMSWASACWVLLPSRRTSSRMSRAPSLSLISM
jgi:hypothetical protein